MKYLLDTNCLIDHFRRGSLSPVSGRIATSLPGELHLCSVVLAELYFGAQRSNASFHAVNLELIEQLRKEIPSLPFDDLAAKVYGDIRNYLASRGTPIGPNDMMIAAIAIVNGLTLVTNNTRELERVPGLTLESWF